MAERILEQARIQPTRRAQELDIEEWRILAESYEREVVKD
jgi:16S rRNA A1518/A1519 N6-dimethyltransferase RsmA/KsgA/DIM1 with predicted DNA glycosylase/AP lyase activity